MKSGVAVVGCSTGKSAGLAPLRIKVDEIGRAAVQAKKPRDRWFQTSFVMLSEANGRKPSTAVTPQRRGFSLVSWRNVLDNRIGQHI